MKLLIVEGNLRDLIADGYPAYAKNFEATLSAIDDSLEFTVAEPFEEPLNVDDLNDVSGVVFTGSSIEAAMDAPECAPQREAMELVFRHDLPSWGSCAGLQLAATVLGGTIGASPNGVEVGLARELILTEKGQDHAMMAGRPPVDFAVPCIHRDEVQRLPQGATLLAQNDHCPVQAFAYETGGIDFWGTQYHPELTPGVIAAGLRRMGGAADLGKLLDVAEQDDASAEALGGRRAALAMPARATELANWLQHVREHGC
ncbi:MAG: type 1 glutamine amidotransferase [Pseudomonadota bacterium]